MLLAASLGRQIEGGLSAQDGSPSDAGQLPAAAQVPAPVAPQKRPREVDSADDPPGALFAKLQRLDSGAKAEDYQKVGSEGGDDDPDSWDVDGLLMDLHLTQRYTPSALESTVAPLRDEVAKLAANKPRVPGAVEVISGLLFLGDAACARDVALVLSYNVTRVINCSPQTVKTGPGYYGPNVEYLELWEDDLLDYCVMQDFDVVWKFATAGGTCLVHCEQGVNRSGALVMGMHMKKRQDEIRATGAPSESPEELLGHTWRYVADLKGRVLTNPGFQRQMLLFARLGCRWFSSVNALWQTPKERKMARFRILAETTARRVVSAAAIVPREQKWRNIVFIRDGTMRGEMRMEQAFELATPESVARAERRIASYAQKSFSKHSAAASA